MDILRNLPVQQPAALRELISIQPGRVVSILTWPLMPALALAFSISSNLR